MKNLHVKARDAGMAPPLMRSRRCGFTLVELLIAVGLFGLVMAGAISVYLTCQRLWLSSTMKTQVTLDATMALNRMVYGVGANHGMRAAARITLLTNVAGYRFGTNFPLSANSTSHYLVTNASAGAIDGSWRMIVSNSLAGEQWIDYNRKASNIVFWPVTTNIAARLLMGNYIADAGIVTNVDGLNISLVASNRFGMISATNAAATYIKLRN